MNHTPSVKAIVILALTSLSYACVQAEDPLPDKVKKLQDNYNAAVAKAVAPLTATYVRELEKMKADFTRAGDLKDAVAVGTLIKDLGETSSKTLSEMSERGFKRWLSTVVIAEVGSQNGNTYQYDNDVICTLKPGSTGLRTHPTATIERGKITIPFTSTTATIVIDDSLTKATVTFSTGGTYTATISKKPN